MIFIQSRQGNARYHDQGQQQWHSSYSQQRWQFYEQQYAQFTAEPELTLFEYFVKCILI